jgi:hypothetical protein
MRNIFCWKQAERKDKPNRIAGLTLRKTDGLELRKNDDFKLLFTNEGV